MINLYWKNAAAAVVGEAGGVSQADRDGISARIAAAHGAVMGQISTGDLGYATLTDRTEYRDAAAELAARYRESTTDLVILGIGGSALGNIALQTALNPAGYNLLSDRRRPGPRLFVLDNIDPALVGDVLALLGRRLKTTLFNVISKSGDTPETVAQFMVVREMLRKKLGAGFAGRIVATTGAEKGTLREVAQADGYATLPVPPDVGGRFSVLSPVGLFSAAMCGIDIDALLAGAAEMAGRAANQDWRANPACMLAAIKYLLYARGRTIQVMMPYSNRLAGLADWYRQLWAESLGKKLDRACQQVFAGPTPVRALGATDQHSQAQLYLEGPHDKLVIFLTVARHPRDVRIPAASGELEGMAYLGKARLSKLLGDEKVSMEYALKQAGRPSVTIRFDAVDPASVGAFIYLYEFVTSLMGELMDVNAYNQPAVELIKRATFARMGRSGYEDLARKVTAFAETDDRFLV